MNLATYQNGYSALHGMLPSLDGYVDVTAMPKLSSFAQPLSAHKVIIFRSKVTVEGSSVFIPEQEFSIHWVSNRLRIENKPTQAWPKIKLDLLADATEGYHVEDLQVTQYEETADAEIKYTRFHWALAHHPSFSIASPKVGSFLFHLVPYSEAKIALLLHSAKMARKLKYIEYVFNKKLPCPQKVDPIDVGVVDIIYRGLTEGEFITRNSSFALKISSQAINWSAPPFHEPGALKLGQDQRGVIDLFGHQLLVGPISIRFEKAVYSGPRNYPPSIKKTEEMIDARFDILDHQEYVRFDKYADKGKKKLCERLAQFKYQYLRDDPKELLELMDAPLIRDVNAEEANLIAVGWLQYNRLPDRYCPQEPILDELNKIWRVPIYLVYASGEGGEVGELQIDIKTGKVISHTPVDTIKAKGKILAENLTHVREATPVLAGD